MSIKQITGLYQIRAALDALAAREAAGNNPLAALKEGFPLIEKGRRHCQTGSIMEMIHTDMEVHRPIYRISGNSEIDRTISPHWYHLLRIMGLVLQRKPPRQLIWDEHAEILNEISKGEVERAEQLARQHGENAAAELAARASEENSL